MKTALRFFLLIIMFGSKIVYGQTYNEVLGRPTDSTITMSIMFNQKVEVYWEIGVTSGNYTITTTAATAAANDPLEFDFTNLSPNTKYFYRTRYRLYGTTSAFSASAEHTFHTQRAVGSTFTFDVEADEHLYDYGDANMYNITLQNEAKDNPDFMISLGDIFGDDHYPLTITSNDCDSLHRLYRSHLGTICHSVPFYVCLGNHEGEKQYYLDSMPSANMGLWSTLWRKYYYPNPYPNNFYSGDTVHEGYGVGQPENYYAWTWGNALFVVLDVYRTDCYTTSTAKPNNWNWTLGLTEYKWLKNTLENSHAQYKFVFAHHVNGESRGGIVPAHLYEWGGYNKTTGGTYQFTAQRPASNGWTKPIHQLFIDNGVNVFFQGHDHLFAHEVMDNVTYQEVPMAADSTYLKGWLNADAYTGDTLPASGHMRVTVSPSCVQVDYVRCFLPKDTLSGANHNREVSFSYTIGSCTTAVHEIKNEMPINIFPNPAANSINIEAQPKSQIEIYNIEGQLINNFINDLNTTNVNISSYTYGIYFVKVKTQNGISVKKFVKE